MNIYQLFIMAIFTYTTKLKYIKYLEKKQICIFNLLYVFHINIPMSLSFINPLFHVFPGKLQILMWLSPVAQAVFSAKRPMSSAVLTYLRLSQLALLGCSLMEGVVSEGHGTLPEIFGYSSSPVTSNFMQPQGGEEYIDGKGLGEGTPCRKLLGSHRSCWAQPFQGSCSSSYLQPLTQYSCK